MRNTQVIMFNINVAVCELLMCLFIVFIKRVNWEKNRVKTKYYFYLSLWFYYSKYVIS